MVASRAAYQLLEQVVGTEAVAQLHQSGESLAALLAERASQAVGHAVTQATKQFAESPLNEGSNEKKAPSGGLWSA